MRVTVELVGEGTREVEVPAGATYADLVDPLPVSVHQVSVVVGDRHVPEDAPVDPDVDTVRVVRLVKGG
jgi:sulfur carrier protein